MTPIFFIMMLVYISMLLSDVSKKFAKIEKRCLAAADDAQRKIELEAWNVLALPSTTLKT